MADDGDAQQDDPDQPDLLRLAIRESDTLEEAAGRLGISTSHIQRLCAKFGIERAGVGPGRRLTPAARQRILRAIDRGESRRTISKTLGVAKSTVSREARRAFEATDKEPTADSPFRPCRVYRCLGCGQRVNVRPCVICWHTSKDQRGTGKQGGV